MWNPKLILLGASWQKKGNGRYTGANRRFMGDLSVRDTVNIRGNPRNLDKTKETL